MLQTLEMQCFRNTHEDSPRYRLHRGPCSLPHLQTPTSDTFGDTEMVSTTSPTFKKGPLLRGKMQQQEFRHAVNTFLALTVVTL